jgi:hypothetical protein
MYISLYFMKNLLSPNPTSVNAVLCLAPFRGFGIHPVCYFAFGGSGVCFNEFETPNKVLPIINGFCGIASGGKE